MKRVKKLFALAMSVLVCAGLAGSPAMAAESGEVDGIQASMETNQEEYQAGEHILITVTAVNNNEEVVNNVILKNDAPQGYRLVAGSTDRSVQDVTAGETVSLTSEYELIPAGSANAPANNDDDDDSSSSRSSSNTTTVATTALTTVVEEEVPLAAGLDAAGQNTVTIEPEAVPLSAAPKTGDETPFMAWMMVFIVCAGTGTVFFIKRKELRKYLALALVVAVAGTAFTQFGTQVKAAGSGNLDLDKQITVAGVEMQITTHVSHADDYIAGIVYSAINPAEKLKDVTVKLREGSNNKQGDYVKDADQNDVVCTTDEQGQFAFYGVAAGNYTAEFVIDGYITGYMNVTCGYEDITAQVPLSPVMDTNQYRVVLTWGETPEDIDSYLNGSTPDGSNYQIDYTHKKEYYGENDDVIAELDVDERHSYGPETVTFTCMPGQEYNYYVKDYTNQEKESSDALSNSGAKVEIYRGEQHIQTVQIPTEKVGIRWNVFKINSDGAIQIINTVTDSDGNEVDAQDLPAEVNVFNMLMTEEATEEISTEQEETTEEVSSEEASSEDTSSEEDASDEASSSEETDEFEESSEEETESEEPESEEAEEASEETEVTE